MATLDCLQINFEKFFLKQKELVDILESECSLINQYLNPLRASIDGTASCHACCCCNRRRQTKTQIRSDTPGGFTID